jgi:glycosyltransferase involved in cell wall biosynthesis
LHVALVSSTASPGGVARHVLDLGAGLQEEGVLVSLDIPAGGREVADAAAARDLRVARAGHGSAPDVVHFHLAGTYDAHSLARMFRLHRHSRIVVTEHLPHSNASDPALPYGGGRWAAQLKTVFKRAQFAQSDATILLSSSCLRFISARYGVRTDRLRVVPNGIPVRSSPSRRRWDGGRVVASGSLIAQKGFEVLIRAAARARSWTVELFGAGPARDALENLARAFDAPVRFLGWRSREQMRLEEATVVCIPSLWESLPYAALEAMSAAVPVVASRVDGLTDLIVDGQSGLLVEPGDDDRLALAITRLVTDPLEAERLGRGGHERVASRFTYQAMVHGVLGVYRELCNR